MGERKSSSALTTKESDAFKKAVTDLIADGKYGEMVKVGFAQAPRQADQSSVTRSCQCGTWVAKPSERTLGSRAIARAPLVSLFVRSSRWSSWTR